MDLDRYNVLHKISALAEGDTDFEQELVRLYTHSFRELKEKFATIITTQNTQELSFISHKYRTTFLMFDMNDIAGEIDRSKTILSSDTLHVEELSIIITKVEKYCEEVLRELGTK